MREAFKAVDPRINEDNFLDRFRRPGCYLVDLYPTPVDRLDAESRWRANFRQTAPLQEADRAWAYVGPMKIASVVRTIADHVTNGRRDRKIARRDPATRYPGRWSRHRAKFVKALEPSLRELLCLPGILDERSIGALISTSQRQSPGVWRSSRHPFSSVVAGVYKLGYIFPSCARMTDHSDTGQH